MYKKTITFKDFDGNDCTETLYFNFSRAELVEMEMEHPGGMSDYIQSIVESHDTVEIMKTFKDILTSAYGVKTPDGKRFIKSKEVLDEFMQSPAYDEFFMEIITDEKTMSDFINSVIPQIPKLPSKEDGKVINLKEATRAALDAKQQ